MQGGAEGVVCRGVPQVSVGLSAAASKVSVYATDSHDCGLRAIDSHDCGLRATDSHDCGLRATDSHNCGLRATDSHNCGLRATGAGCWIARPSLLQASHVLFTDVVYAITVEWCTLCRGAVYFKAREEEQRPTCSYHLVRLVHIGQLAL